MKKYAVEVVKELKNGMYESYGNSDMIIEENLKDATDKMIELSENYKYYNPKDIYTIYVHLIDIEDGARLGDFEIINTIDYLGGIE
jgi:hypothetical protein